MPSEERKVRGEQGITAPEALSYIHSYSRLGSKPGLSRTAELLQRMGSPEKKLRFIHIAGTNGKGSTAAMLASVLQSAGYAAGLYISPSLFRFHERIQVNGEQISDNALGAVTEFVRSCAEEMEDRPTEFELVTCIAFEHFRRTGCGIVVLEVGMGEGWIPQMSFPHPRWPSLPTSGLTIPGNLAIPWKRRPSSNLYITEKVFKTRG